MIGEEGQGRPLETSCHYAHVAFNELLPSWTILADALRSMVEHYTILRKALNVATEPLSFARADKIKDTVVDHWRFSKQPLARAFGRSNILEVTVEEKAQKGFRNPTQYCLLAKNIHR